MDTDNLPAVASELPVVPENLDELETAQWREMVLQQVCKNISWNFLIAGKMLHEIQESGYLEKIGETMAAYLSSRGIGFGESAASKMMKVYKVFIAQHHVAPALIADIGDYEKAYKAANLVSRDGMGVEEAISQAKHLSRSDLTQVKRELRGEDELDEVMVQRLLNKWLAGFNRRQQLLVASLLAEVRENREELQEIIPAIEYAVKAMTFKEVMTIEARLQEKLMAAAA